MFQVFEIFQLKSCWSWPWRVANIWIEDQLNSPLLISNTVI